MKGRRDPECDWEPELGAAILQARMELYLRLSDAVGIPCADVFWRSHEAIGAFMGLSDHAVQLIERRALRKLRIIMSIRFPLLYAELLAEMRWMNGKKDLSSH